MDILDRIFQKLESSSPKLSLEERNEFLALIRRISSLSVVHQEARVLIHRVFNSSIETCLEVMIDSEETLFNRPRFVPHAITVQTDRVPINHSVIHDDHRKLINFLGGVKYKGDFQAKATRFFSFQEIVATFNEGVPSAIIFATRGDSTFSVNIESGFVSIQNPATGGQRRYHTDSVLSFLQNLCR